MARFFLISLAILSIGGFCPDSHTISARVIYKDTDSDSDALTPAERAIIRTITHSKNLVYPNGLARPIGQQSQTAVLPTPGQFNGGYLGQGRFPVNQYGLQNTGLGYNNLVQPGLAYGGIQNAGYQQTGLGNVGYTVGGQGTRYFDSDGDADLAEEDLAGPDTDGEEEDVIVRLPKRLLYHLIRRFGVRKNEATKGTKPVATGRFSTGHHRRRAVRRLIRRLMKAAMASKRAD